ncbi:Protein of unknown function (DUF295 [Striga hermonthica]|uniref:KIB1-4 beta-propeller domain-containing protein n=1 Tax=Striga hermonthica TaxID=68872 RepID=A0A9N7R9L8_STRHE|nr:Protein of unknown function (DUF295 [Striga hermonthica]
MIVGDVGFFSDDNNREATDNISHSVVRNSSSDDNNRGATDNKSHSVVRNSSSDDNNRGATDNKLHSVVRNSSSDDNSTAMIRNSSVKSPWLMLPPSVECGNMLYNFYNLAESKIERLRSTLEVDDDAKLVCSSHGWIAVLNQRNHGLLLWNPITQVRINLPSLLTLPDPQINCCGIVSKLILSCSPDNDLDQCRAMMIFGPLNRLAFCQPGRSTHWTPIGHLYWSKKFYSEVHNHDDGMFAMQYTDCVYSTTHKLFFCFVIWRLECWDLQDLECPRICWSEIVHYMVGVASEEETMALSFTTGGYPDVMNQHFLVVAEQMNQLFLLTRHVCLRMGLDGTNRPPIYFGKYRGWDDKFPHQTYSFDVFKVDYISGGDGTQPKLIMTNLEGSLDGLAMFIGKNHSFAISTPTSHGLERDCIYFTDTNIHQPPAGSIYGGHDIGIYHCATRTFSDCFYPRDTNKIKKIVPAPMWFTPNDSTH